MANFHCSSLTTCMLGGFTMDLELNPGTFKSHLATMYEYGNPPIINKCHFRLRTVNKFNLGH
uniref:Uncharacterized protein n=1 Tax=Arundo donax TaxID=35708 RepID=A0A0A9D3S7_ARUDO